MHTISRAESVDVRFNPVYFGHSCTHRLVWIRCLQLFICKKKREESLLLLPYFISGGNVYANLRGINIRENTLTLLYAFPWVQICVVLKLRVFAKKYSVSCAEHAHEQMWKRNSEYFLTRFKLNWSADYKFDKYICKFACEFCY